MTAVERAEKIAGVRELLDWLEAHPDVPMPSISSGGYASYYPNNSGGGQDVIPALAELRRVAAVLGVDPADFTVTAHVTLTGPAFRGDVLYTATVCDAAEEWQRQQAQDITHGEGKVAGAHGDGAPATAATETAVSVQTPLADGTSDVKAPFLDDVPAADPAQAPSAGGAAVTPEQVWTATIRQGLTYHALDDALRVGCGRSMRTGHVIGMPEAVALAGDPCKRCYPAPDGRGAGLS